MSNRSVRRIALALLTFLCAGESLAAGWFQKSSPLAECQHLFPRQDTSVVARYVKPQVVALCSTNFAVLHSSATKTPILVVERLNSALLRDAKDEQRTNEFYPDFRLAVGSRAELWDYRNSGFDRGHLASAADQPDQRSMMESFALSNAVPQDPVNNRKIWAKVEGDVRKFARRAKGDVFVFTGPLFSAESKTIGPSRVWVPDRLFKLVFDEASGRKWAYLLDNTATARILPPISYQEFVKHTGWDVLPTAR